MRFDFIALLPILLIFNSCQELDPKLIASRYRDGIVKIILFDPELEEKSPGKGYLSRGSGFFVTEDGYIFTNRHVVEQCVTGYVDYDYYDAAGKKKAGISTYSEELIKGKNFIKAYNSGYPIPLVQVFTGEGENDYKLYHAEVVSIGMGAFDGALLRVVSDADGKKGNFRFTAIPIGDSDEVSQGEPLCVFGYPAQIKKGGADIMLRDVSTLSRGIMSGLDYVFNNDYGYMKTDAEIHPGNSGGPVFNEQNKAIGIATSKGIATGIGLVGGINGMYYVAAGDSKALEKLKARGLKTPKRAFSINTVIGKKQPMKSVTEINSSLNKKSGYKSNYSTTKNVPKYNPSNSYANTKLFFSNISYKKNNNQIPTKSKQYTSFSISKINGGVVWVYLDNYPLKLNTESLTVYIDKLQNGLYKQYDKIKYDIYANDYRTYFSTTFREEGTYRYTIYSKTFKKIASKTVYISYKKNNSLN